jgi:tetratricopeptide (TPR) repeat protein/nucleoside phosphorylase
MQNATVSEFADLEPDIVILTATITERDCVIGSMRPLSDRSEIVKIAFGPDTFYLGILGCQTIVLTMCGMGTIGRDGSSLTVSDAIRTWNPKAIIAVGIAFGIDPDRQRIGDVLVSKTVGSYEPQRVQDDLIISRGVVAESGLHLFNRFINVHGWSFQRPDGSLVELRAGQILSGDKLVDSLNFKQRLLERYPEAIGGEMEGAGLYAAAERAKIEWIIVKGICDWADGNKDKQYQRFAAAAAISLVEHVLNDANAISDLKRPRETAALGPAQFERATLPSLFQLPSPVSDFVGRENEIAMLLNVLQPSQRSAITSINGLPGTGKSELAIWVANQLRSSYPDAQLFIRMCGVDESPREPRDVLAACIRELMGTNVESTTDLDLLINQYRTCLAQKRALIVLDNVVDAAQVRPLLPPIGSAVIVTSRNSLSLSPITRLFLDQLRPQEAKELFGSIVPGVTPDIVDEISALCGYLPLALRAAATLLAVRVDLDPNSFLETLRHERTRLEQLSSHEATVVSVNASFNLSYQNLDSELARVLRQLTVFVESFDAQAEEFVCNDASHQMLSELVKRSLLGFDEVTRRYHFHDLFRLFAKQQIGVTESRDFEQRHAAYYLGLLHKANSFSSRGASLYQEGLDLFDRDRGNIEAGFAWAKDAALKNEPAAACYVQYLIAGRYLLDLRQSLTDRISFLEYALTFETTKDKHQVTAIKNSLGWALARSKNIEKAIATLDEALALARELADRKEECLALDTLGWCYADMEELGRAVEYHQEALAIAKDLDDLRLQCRALNNLGWAHVGLGEGKRAIEFHQDALAIARNLGDSYEEGIITQYLARATVDQKEVQQAIDLYETGLTIFRGVGSKRDEWSVLDSLGTIYKDQGEILRAIQYYEKGLAVARLEDDLASQSTALNNLGRAHYALNDYPRALQFHEQDLSLCRKLNNPRRESLALEYLGDCYWEMTDFPKALENYLRRLELHRQLENRPEELRSLLDIGNLLLSFEEMERALENYTAALALAKELANENTEAWVLYNFGRAHFQLRQHERAADFYQRGLSMFRATNDLDGQARALLQLGNLYRDQKQSEAAIEHSESLLLLARQNPGQVEASHEIEALMNLGIAHCQLGNTTKGLPLFHEALLKVEQSKDRGFETSILNAIGYFHRSSNLDLAIKYCEKALSLASVRDDKLEKFRALSFLGELCRVKDPARAISHLEEVLAAGTEMIPVFRLTEQSFPVWQAKVMRLVGELHLKLEDFRSGLQYLERALTTFEEFDQQDQVGKVLNLAGACHSSLGNEERAIECLERAISIFRATEDAAAEAQSLVRLVYAYSKLEDVRRTKEFCEEALPFFKTLGVDRRFELVALLLLAGAHLKSGNPEQADSYFEEALLLSRELEGSVDPSMSEPAVLINIGYSYVVTGKAKRGIETLKKALSIARARDNKKLEGEALDNLGSALEKLDQLRRAIGFYQRALLVYTETGSRKEQGVVLIGLGDAYRRVNEIALSLEAYHGVLAIAPEIKDRRWERKALTGIGTTYREDGQLEQAIDFHQQALKLAREETDRLGEGAVLLQLGKDYNELLEHERAIDIQEKALLIFNEVRSRSDEACALETLGDSYRKVGQFGRAIRLHEEGLVVTREYSDGFKEAWLLGCLAEDHFKAGALDKAQEVSNHQLELSRELGDQCRVANAEFRLAQIAYAKGDQPQALKQARSALKILQKIESTEAGDVLEKIGGWRARVGHARNDRFSID